MSEFSPTRLSAHELDVRAAASKWLIELETASSVEAIWPQFQDWLSADPGHKAAYLRVERAWHALDALREACPREASSEAVVLPRRNLWRNGLGWALVTIVIIAALVIAVLS